MLKIQTSVGSIKTLTIITKKNHKKIIKRSYIFNRYLSIENLFIQSWQLIYQTVKHTVQIGKLGFSIIHRGQWAQELSWNVAAHAIHVSQSCTCDSYRKQSCRHFVSILSNLTASVSSVSQFRIIRLSFAWHPARFVCSLTRSIPCTGIPQGRIVKR